jgi:hypothetical protein
MQNSRTLGQSRSFARRFHPRKILLFALLAAGCGGGYLKTSNPDELRRGRWARNGHNNQETIRLLNIVRCSLLTDAQNNQEKLWSAAELRADDGRV